MKNKNTPNTDLQSVIQLLEFQYKLANALKSSSIDSFTSFEKRMCSLAVKVYNHKNIQQSKLHFLAAFIKWKNSHIYLDKIPEIKYQDLDNDYECIDDLVYFAWQEVNEYHQSEILKIKLEATKHKISGEMGNDPDDPD